MMGFQGFLRPRPDQRGAGVNSIKSIQNGLASITPGTTNSNVPISKVDSSKSIILVSFEAGAGISSDDNTYVRADWLSDEMFQLTRKGSVGQVTINWTVIEFVGIKSLQSGFVTLTANPQTVAISEVNPSKCAVFYSYTSYATNVIRENVRCFVSSPTQLTFRQQDLTTKELRWFLVEFF